ncbi:MAG: Smr/MutS family protein [Proteobacteria bacterium]|nr:Smr/MutS family protein [Pseudomonadota bacterium]
MTRNRANAPSPRRARREAGSAADARLWRAVVGDVKPLRGRKGASAPPAKPAPEPESEAKQEPEGPEGKEARAQRPRAAPAPRPAPRPASAPPQPPELPSLRPGHSPGLDKRRAQRLRRGQMPVEGSIDLHGLTQKQAAHALGAFLTDAQEAGRRCVLVITGKGDAKGEAGVLRAMAPRWLNEPPNRARILAFEVAQPKHGGQGALYVLLRRKR